MKTPSVPTSLNQFRNRKAACLPIILAVAATGVQLSSQPPSIAGGPTGSVGGRVVSEGKPQPAIFVKIQLVPKPASLEADNPQEQAGSSNPPKPHVSLINGRAELDGSFRMDGVPGGDYFIGAISPG